MPEPFDPYHEFLGIDKRNRPPDHYALLGLAIFESDPKKIDEAATDRMSRLQDLANSEFVDHSQRLLNELSAARRCLLNPVQKMAYDEALRAKKQRAKQVAVKNPPGSKGARTKKQLILIGIGIVLLLCVAFLMRGGETIENTNLIVDWPLADRAGGTLFIDSQPRPLPTSDPMRIAVPDGRHRIVFQRPRYREISQTILFTQTPVRLKLRWIPIRQ